MKSTVKKFGSFLTLGGVLAVGGTAMSSTARADTAAPGVSTETVLDSSIPLINGAGQSVPGLQSGASMQGVSALKLSPTGGVLVGEKNGRIVYFPNIKAKKGYALTTSDGKDLSNDTLALIDTGLGGIAFDPAWPLRPYVYAFYTSNDKLPGQGTGKWKNSECGGNACIIQGKIERLTVLPRVANHTMVPQITQRKTLVTDWCQTANTHSIGDLAFDQSGYLYASAGDGSPLGATSALQTKVCKPSVPGRSGAVDVLNPDIHPSLNGKIIRINPDTGAAAPNNPAARSSDANRARIVASGFRNPYRMNFSPDFSKLGLTTVGESRRESVYTISRRDMSRKVQNANWPCEEAGLPFEDTDALCKAPFQNNAHAIKPDVYWDRGQPLDPAQPCPTNSPASAMGIAYTRPWGVASQYRNSMIFGDYAAGCIWSKKDSEPAKFVLQSGRHTFRSIQVSLTGQIYLADYASGSIRELILK